MGIENVTQELPTTQETVQPNPKPQSRSTHTPSFLFLPLSSYVQRSKRQWAPMYLLKLPKAPSPIVLFIDYPLSSPSRITPTDSLRDTTPSESLRIQRSSRRLPPPCKFDGFLDDAITWLP